MGRNAEAPAVALRSSMRICEIAKTIFNAWAGAGDTRDTRRACLAYGSSSVSQYK